MVSNATCWTLIIVGIVLMVVGGVLAYGGFPSVPSALFTAGLIAFWIGVILLILGIALRIANAIQQKTG